MLLTKNNPARQTDSSAEKRDPLGLTPLPVENRQRFLRFVLSQKNDMLIPLSNILEVIQLALEEILPVPDMPGCVLGVCSWQSETLWLVDLNAMVGDRTLLQQPTAITKPTVIVIQAQEKSLGLVVESVSDIDLIDPSQIQMEKGICPASLEPYVTGYCPNQTGTVLNASKIVHSPLLQPH